MLLNAYKLVAWPQKIVPLTLKQQQQKLDQKDSNEEKLRDIIFTIV